LPDLLEALEGKQANAEGSPGGDVPSAAQGSGQLLLADTWTQAQPRASITLRTFCWDGRPAYFCVVPA
jgi:hypothetical protein